MTVETPREGDRVRVTYEGTYMREVQDGWHKVEVGNHAYPMYPSSDATVEVLERADDPSKALRGEVREIDGMAAVRYGKDMWVYFSPIHHGATGGYGIYRDEQVVGTPVIGVVPHTPAAEQFIPEWERELIEKESPARPSVRVENTPDRLSIPDRQKVADLLVAGDAMRAVLAAANAGLSREQAEAYVRQMPEYETYLNHHGGERGGEPTEAAKVRMRHMQELENVKRQADDVRREQLAEALRAATDLPWKDLLVEARALTDHAYGRTEVDPTEADRMRAMGFDRQPEFKVSDEDRASIQAVLDERTTEYVYGQDDGSWKLDGTALAGVVADIVYAVRVQDRKRGDR